MKPRGLALLGLGLTLLGGVSYFFLMSFPFIRNTAIPNVSLVVAGMALGIWAVVKKRGWWTIAPTVISVLLGGVYLGSIFFLLKLPAPEAIARTTETIPDVTLVNQDGKDVRLADYRGRGPVLLVFYRGHW